MKATTASILLAALTLLCVASPLTAGDKSPAPAAKPRPALTTEYNAIVSATKAGIAKDQEGLKCRVKVEKVVDGWARVLIIPIGVTSDNAIGYLQKKEGKWTLVDFGTGNDDEFARKAIGAPKSVWAN
ncbi:MAG: hypothetical protein H7A55_21440 [Verrucomicrobiaceae bacterium]|nr:hypothetical protein [Verrucomicrobiaceae bacterium]